MSSRDDLIKGLREAADWLEANPAAPYGPHQTVYVQHNVDFRDRAAEVEEIDRTAKALGVEAGSLFASNGRQYGFIKGFGVVRYMAVSIENEEEVAGEHAER